MRHYTYCMQIQLSNETQARLQELATETGQAPEQIVEQLVSERLSHDEWFRASVAEGFASLDRGDFFTQEQAELRVSKLYKD